MTESNNTLQATLCSGNIEMDNVLAYAIAHEFGTLSAFDEVCKKRAVVHIFSDTEGLHEVDFYHKFKPSLLKHLRAHSLDNGYSCGFDWVDSAMSSKGYDRDETARALYEELIEGVKPTKAHCDISEIIVHLATEMLIAAHQEALLNAA